MLKETRNLKNHEIENYPSVLYSIPEGRFGVSMGSDNSEYLEWLITVM